MEGGAPVAKSENLSLPFADRSLKQQKLRAIRFQKVLGPGA